MWAVIEHRETVFYVPKIENSVSKEQFPMYIKKNRYKECRATSEGKC